MDISVVLPTWNNARQLAVTLRELVACRVPAGTSWELIVVNNNCTDDTDAVVERARGQLPLVYVKEPRPGVSLARNAGLRAATGRLLVSADDDIYPSPGWLASYWDAYRRHPAGVYFGGPIVSVFERPDYDPALVALAPRSIRGFSLAQASGPTSRGREFMGANWACPRDMLLALGGFDERLGQNPASGRVMTGEETDLIGRLDRAGWTAYYVAEATLGHFVPAAKCRLEHIAARWGAVGEKRAMDIIGTPGFQRRPGVPVAARIELFANWARWAARRARRQHGYSEYRQLCRSRRLVAVLKAEAARRRQA
jgi:glycosyltransferase involved in cell wall biosynthesis